MPFAPWSFEKYYNDPDARIYDMFTMIDFYGVKKQMRALGHPLKSDDQKWPME